MGNKKDVLFDSAFEATQYINERNYWLHQMSGELTRSAFPYDHKKSLEHPRMMEKTFSCPGDIASKLMGISNNSDLSLHLILMAGFILLLNKYTLNDDIIVGTPIYTEEWSDHLIKINNKALAIRQPFHEDCTFKEMLLQVRDTIAKACENYAYPIEKLCEQLNLTGIDNEFPLFDVALILENIQAKSDLQHIPCNILFSFLRTGSDISGAVAFNALLYNSATIERITAHFLQLLSNALFNPDLNIREIEILPEEEKRQLLEEFGRLPASYPGDKTIHQLFEEQAARTPHHIAIVGPVLPVQPVPPVSLTYRRLNEQSDRLAGLLIERGVQPDTIVGIMMERSVEMIVGLLGILKSGGAYLPIDPECPHQRVDYMLKDSGAKLLVTTNDNEGENVKRWDVEKILIDDISVSPKKSVIPLTHLPSDLQKSPNLAYVIYTSGTTGRPKGVLIKHQGFINLVYYHRDIFGENQDSRMSQVANPAFDAMGFEVWPCLLSGAALHIVDNDIRLSPPGLRDWLIGRGITISFQTTLMAEHLLAESWPHEGVELKSLLTAGDKLNRCPQHTYPFKLYNLYGPTEDTVWTTWTVVETDPEPVRSPVIGKPVANHQVYILDSNLKLQPVGAPGELCISGVGLALGYLNNPQLTAAKFVSNDLPGDQSQMTDAGLYKTGDLARWLEDGTIEFLGRIDQQIKIRGFRVELEEIENWLAKHADIKEAVVLVQEEEGRDKYLCAYVVPNHETVIPELREYLAAELPDYMIPSHFVPLEKIPLTPNGKVDRRALPKPKLNGGENYAAPQDEIERKLVKLWSEVLGIKEAEISTNRSFFELGGHSLTATELVSKIHKELNVSVPLMVELFKGPTIEALARYIVNAEKTPFKPANERLMRLKHESVNSVNMFLIHDGTGEVEGYLEFCRHITKELNIWGLRIQRIETLAPYDITIRELARTYIEAMKQVQPSGPYYIAGWSLGGTIAYEMAAQLEQSNREVERLFLVDSPPPDILALETTEKFSLKTELNFINNFNIGAEVFESFRNFSDIGLDQFWSIVVNYLETNDFDVEVLKKLIVKHGKLVLPNFDRLGIKESIYYLNIGRTLRHARDSYIPNGKLKTKIHYFGASGSWQIKKKDWNDFTDKPVLFYTVKGNHLSILKEPRVSELVQMIEREIING